MEDAKLWGKIVVYMLQGFCDTRGYQDWVCVTRVVDGGETPLFKQYFESWEDPWTKDETPQNNIASKFDAVHLLIITFNATLHFAFNFTYCYLVIYYFTSLEYKLLLAGNFNLL